MDCKQDFVVFSIYDNDGGNTCFYSTSRERAADRTLAGLVNYAGNWKGFTLGTTTPIAWAVEDGSSLETLRAESLAAGRLIEKTPSGWVALGAEKKGNRLLTHEELSESIQQILNEAGAVAESNAKRLAYEASKTELRKGDPSPADVDMIDRDQRPQGAVRFDPFKGFRVGSNHIWQVGEERADHASPFGIFRSPDLAGPSDHLNASRHQMAGMSKS